MATQIRPQIERLSLGLIGGNETRNMDFRQIQYPYKIYSGQAEINPKSSINIQLLKPISLPFSFF
jgi:hypothetical protein